MKRTASAITVALVALASLPVACTDILGKIPFAPEGSGGGGTGGGGSTTTTTSTGGSGTTSSTSGTTTSTGGSGTTSSTTGTGGGAPFTCSDGKKSPDETDVDCGGSNQCQRCSIGQQCAVDSDCGPGICAQGVCCSTVCNGTCMSCNGADTGGVSGTCAQATAGKDPDMLCTAANLGKCDVSGMCGCANGIKDGTETDVDCGGSECGLCGDGKTCGDSGDCTNAHCVTTASVGKICCDQACSGPCVSCGLTNFIGSCKPVPVGTDCGGGKGCNASQACVTAYANGTGCGSNGECLSNQCIGNPKKCQRNDPAGYPCTQDFDCASGTCNQTTHICD